MIALSLDQLVAWGVLYYSYSVLAVPIARDLGLASSTVAAAFSGSLLVSALLARRVGRLLDRGGAQPVLLCGAVVALLALGGLASVRGVLPLLLVFAGLGVAQALSLYEPAFRAVVDWFPRARQRSQALLVVTSVAGFASTLFLPLIAFLLAGFGWRSAVLILAAIAAFVTLPVRLWLLRRVPRARAAESTSNVLAGAPAARLLGAGFALQAFAATGATVCLVWQLVERGETLEAAAALAGLAGAAQVPGRLLLSPLSSVLPTQIRLPALLVAQAGALVGIAVFSGSALVVAVMIFGAAAGVMTLERAKVVVEWFGRERFGAGSGLLAFAASLARAGAPFAVELVHGSTSYAGVFALLSGCLLLGSAMLAVATRFRPPTNEAKPLEAEQYQRLGLNFWKIRRKPC
ncbi:MAG TPA: MFS transporter [Polyangiaceae bacterium]|nr:MFS transporter [Polyangiaceae bacterium]